MKCDGKRRPGSKGSVDVHVWGEGSQTRQSKHVSQWRRVCVTDGAKARLGPSADLCLSACVHISGTRSMVDKDNDDDNDDKENDDDSNAQRHQADDSAVRGIGIVGDRGG
jgi:hypothetical protein